MFNQLIESSSHKKELKRRGSFVVFTTGLYAVLFVITGVVSIYAYDTHLEQQILDRILVMRPSEMPITSDVVIGCGPGLDHGGRKTAGNGSDKTQTTHALDNPAAVPEGISTEAFKGITLPSGGRKDGPETDIDATEVSGFGSRYQTSTLKQIEVLPDELPPTPTPTPVKVVKATKLINGLAVYLPKPNYPAMAKQIHLEGSVNVQVLIDETGKVISAKAVSGHPLLVPESLRAATNARFTPTMLNGQPVKLSGVIVYNFVMQ